MSVLVPMFVVLLTAIYAVYLSYKRKEIKWIILHSIAVGFDIGVILVIIFESLF